MKKTISFKKPLKNQIFSLKSQNIAGCKKVSGRHFNFVWPQKGVGEGDLHSKSFTDGGQMPEHPPLILRLWVALRIPHTAHIKAVMFATAVGTRKGVGKAAQSPEACARYWRRKYHTCGPRSVSNLRRIRKKGNKNSWIISSINSILDQQEQNCSLRSSSESIEERECKRKAWSLHLVM